MEEILATLLFVPIASLQITFSVISCVRKVREGWRPSWRMFGFLFQGCCGQSAEDVTEEQKDAPHSILITRVAERRVELTEGFATIWTRFCGAWAITSIFRFVLGFPTIGTVVSHTLFLTMYLSTVFIIFNPALLKRHITFYLHVWMHGLIFCWGTYLSIWHKDQFDLWKSGIILARVAIGIGHPWQCANAVWNVAWAVLGILCRSSDLPLTNVITDEILIAFALIFIVAKFQEIQTDQVRSDIKASGYLRAKRTMERLLADMCDAVVELDPELRIRQACPKLAGLLLKDVGITALRGDSFAGLALTEEDGDRFSNFVAQRAVPMALEQNVEGNRRGSSMYMNLRDSTGTPVAVQVFHSCHHDPFDQLCHVVGVHEVDNNDAQGARDTLGTGNWREGVEHQPVERSSQAENAIQTASEAGQQGGLGVESESVASSVASFVSESEASDCPVRTVPLIPKGTMGEHSMLFDVRTDEIIATTTTFPSITGPLRFRANLADFIVDYDQFRAWLQTEIGRASTGEQWSALDVKIVPVGSRKEAHFEFNTQVAILDIHEGVFASQFGVEHVGDAEEHRFEQLVVLVFKKPEPQWRKKGIKQRRRSRRRPSQRVLQQQPRNQVYEIAL